MHKVHPIASTNLTQHVMSHQRSLCPTFEPRVGAPLACYPVLVNQNKAKARVNTALLPTELPSAIESKYTPSHHNTNDVQSGPSSNCLHSRHAWLKPHLLTPTLHTRNPAPHSSHSRLSIPVEYLAPWQP